MLFVQYVNSQLEVQAGILIAISNMVLGMRGEGWVGRGMLGRGGGEVGLGSGKCLPL